MEKNLAQLNREDALDDEFFMQLSLDGKYLATGAYNRSAHVIDTNANTNISIACNHVQTPGQNAGVLKAYNKQKRLIGSSMFNDFAGGESAQKQQKEKA